MDTLRHGTSGETARRRARPPWSRRLLLVASLSTVVIGAMTLLAWRGVQTLNDEASWIAHGERVRFQIERILALMIDVQSSARVYVRSGNALFLDRYATALPGVAPTVQELGALVADNPAQRRLFERLDAESRKLTTYTQRLVDLARSGKAHQASDLVDDGVGERVLGTARSLLAEMQRQEATLLESRRAIAERARHDSQLALWATAAIAVALLLMVMLMTQREGERLRRTELDLATTLRSVGDAVIATDAFGGIRFMNRVAEALTGWTEDGALGKPLGQVLCALDPVTRRPVTQPLTDLSPRKPVAVSGPDMLLRSRDGIERTAAVSSAPVVDASGEAQGRVLVLRDVTVEREAERTLRLRESELRIISDHARFPIARLDTEHRYLFVNQAYAERFNLAPQQCVGRHIRDIAGEPAYESIRPYAEVALTGKAMDFEVEVPYALLGPRYMRCVYAPERDEHGMVRSFVAAVLDITDRKRAEDALRRSEAALREAHARKDEFLATLSHELRNPLAPLRVAAQLLESPELPPAETLRLRGIIARQVTHMSTLLDDLLDVSRITRGALTLRKAPVSLREIFEAALETAQPLIDTRRHAIKVEWPPAPLRLEVDGVRLTQVVANLLTNAAKYTPRAGRITFGSRLEGARVVLYVRDTGIGIPKEMQGKIFEMFAQLSVDPQSSEGGLGIGLALVKGLVELHDGVVEVSSAGSGRGSEFRVSLPGSCVVAAADTPARVPLPAGERRRRRVMVADDNVEAAETLAMFLELSGHEVYIAFNGAQALDLAGLRKPEFCLIDVGMPELDGYEVARRLRQEPWGAELRLIALTGWGQEDDRRAALEAGFDHHVTKPMDPTLLERLFTSLDDAGRSRHASRPPRGASAG